jgi:hypothetical protein
MDLMLLRLLQKQTLEQCTFILIAADQLQHRISSRTYDDVFWREMQNFVASTANVSKLLWGQKAKLANQRKALRDSIMVTDSSPLKPTVMRNHFEHFDERLVRWWAESEELGRYSYTDRNIGVQDMWAKPEEKPFRGFDPSTSMLTFWGDTYNLREIVEEVNRIYPLLTAEAARSPWKE